MNLGITFQLVDDALDYGGAASRLGKNIGDDFREGKITLPVVLAFRRGSDSEREFWRRTLERGETADAAWSEPVVECHGSDSGREIDCCGHARRFSHARGLYPHEGEVRTPGPVQHHERDLVFGHRFERPRLHERDGYDRGGGPVFSGLESSVGGR